MPRKISKETKAKYPELSKIDGTITNVVNENSKLITQLFEDEEVSDEDFKESILEILDQAKQTKYVKSAIDKIERMDDRKEICYYMYNMALSGDGLKAI